MNVPDRHRESPFPMISVEKALDLIRSSVQQQGSEIVYLHEAHGRVLSSYILSKCDLPPFRASIKDGYAVLASDGKGRRKVLCGVTAGSTVSFDKPRYNESDL